MNENYPEFPKASPEMKYLLQQFHILTENMVVSNSYHDDHNELRARLDKIDKTYAEINSLIKNTDYSNLIYLVNELKRMHEMYSQNIVDTSDTIQLRMESGISQMLSQLEVDNKSLLLKCEKEYSKKYIELISTVQMQCINNRSLFTENEEFVRKNTELLNDINSKFSEIQTYMETKIQQFEEMHTKKVDEQVEIVSEKFADRVFSKLDEKKDSCLKYAVFIVVGLIGGVIIKGLI